MDSGRLNYLRNTEGCRVSKGECEGESVTRLYTMSKKILKEVLGHYKDYSTYRELQREVTRVKNKQYMDFQHLIEQRVDRISGVRKLEKIENFIDNKDYLNAVKEILR